MFIWKIYKDQKNHARVIVQDAGRNMTILLISLAPGAEERSAPGQFKKFFLGLKYDTQVPIDDK